MNSQTDIFTVHFSCVFNSDDDGLCGIYVKQLKGNAILKNGMYYVHPDHLGSFAVITDVMGNVVQKCSFDAWGNRKFEVKDPELVFDRGYTGHEHLPEFGLINMNGRMYDPMVGRFLSPDPFVQAPDFSQSYNRYSYCLNNPLYYTDPSGELAWAAIPLIVKIGIGIGTAAGAYTGYKIADAKGYNFGDLQTYGYMLGGAAIGGLSAYAGATIAAGGGFMANTASIMYSSTFNSMGMAVLSGGMMSPSISFGVASYDFGTGKWGYLGKKGNSALENIGYGFGALANLTDVVSLFGGGTNTDLIVEKKDAISHSALVNESEGINVSVGPYRELGEGIDMTALKSGTGTFKELSRTMKGKVWANHATDGLGWKVPINNVNKNILSKLSTNLQTKMNNQTLMWNLLGKSCVGYTAKALWSVGVPNLGGIHPYWLQLQMITRQFGIYSSPYLYQIP
jgi:RHS repeat-associated protein